MSEQILTLLNNPDASQRKRGISAAAKTADRRYLKPLAQIYKTDPDPALRELAKKAGAYINKQQPVPVTQPATVSPSRSVDDDLMALRDDALSDAYHDPQPEPAAPVADALPDLATLLDTSEPAPPAPAPAAIAHHQNIVTAKEPNPKQANVHFNNAFDLNMQGNNGMAALELGTAFHLNPALVNDTAAVALAAELAGVPKEQAAAYISNPANWKAITDRHGGTQGGIDTATTTNSLLLWIGGGIALTIVIVVLLVVVQSEAFSEIIRQTFQDLFGGAAPGLEPVPPR